MTSNRIQFNEISFAIMSEDFSEKRKYTDTTTVIVATKTHILHIITSVLLVLKFVQWRNKNEQ